MKITGLVQSALDKRSIENAGVTFVHAGRGLKSIYTSSTGQFEESMILPSSTGSLLCRIEKDGYQTKEVPCLTDQDEIKLGVIEMEQGKDGNGSSPNWGKIAGIIGILLFVCVVLYQAIPSPTPSTRSPAVSIPIIIQFSATPMGNCGEIDWAVENTESITLEIRDGPDAPLQGIPIAPKEVVNGHKTLCAGTDYLEVSLTAQNGLGRTHRTEKLSFK